MTTANCINSIGLVFDIGGAYLLWKFGLPAAISREGKIYMIAEQNDPVEAEKANWYDAIGKWGLILLVIGFVLQLVSNFL